MRAPHRLFHRLRVESRVLDDRGRVGDVEVTTVAVAEYEDGELVERTRDYYAQGEDGAVAAEPRVGVRFAQERAPGVAEDRSTVVAAGLTVRTAAGRWSGCIRTRDVAPLDGATELEVYCPGVGLVREQAPGGSVELVLYAKR